MVFPLFLVSEHSRSAISVFAALLHGVAFLAGLAAFVYNIAVYWITGDSLIYLMSPIFSRLPLVVGLVVLLSTPVQAFAVVYVLDQAQAKTRWKPREIVDFKVPLIFGVVTATAALLLNLYYWSNFTTSFSIGMFDGMINYEKNIETKQRVDWMQSQFMCCGVTGPMDYIDKSHIKDVDHPFLKGGFNYTWCTKSDSTVGCYIPFSCCQRKHYTCSGWVHHYINAGMLPTDLNLTQFYNESGCVNAVQGQFNVVWSLSFLGGFLGLQLLALVFTQITRSAAFVLASTDAIENCKIPAWIVSFIKHSPEAIVKLTRTQFEKGDDFDIALLNGKPQKEKKEEEEEDEDEESAKSQKEKSEKSKKDDAQKSRKDGKQVGSPSAAEKSSVTKK
ncbi:hypothetical protein QR680_004981 [Steinernema hermaphroditum]|uniref:Tetraspanin n=1 Tax=Steinernema hermaphroditum TaxID=289476 RepID=A0AA39HRV6_9BILA|nr:hypothetical protein QR680_004981 [Steinernema hermaphroditum]